MTDIIVKCLNVVLKNIIDRALPPGTRRKRKDGLYEKQPNGKWLKIKEKKVEGKKEKLSYAKKINKWDNLAKKWEDQENIGFRAVNNLEDIKKPSIDIFGKDEIIEIGNINGFTYDEDYNEVPYEEVKEKVLDKLLETYQNNNLDVEYEETEEGYKFTYPGVNTTVSFDPNLQGSYEYLVVLEGETQGFNYFDETPVKSVDQIKAIYDSNGNEVKLK